MQLKKKKISLQGKEKKVVPKKKILMFSISDLQIATLILTSAPNKARQPNSDYLSSSAEPTPLDHPTQSIAVFLEAFREAKLNRAKKRSIQNMVPQQPSKISRRRSEKFPRPPPLNPTLAEESTKMNNSSILSMSGTTPLLAQSTNSNSIFLLPTALNRSGGSNISPGSFRFPPPESSPIFLNDINKLNEVVRGRYILTGDIYKLNRNKKIVWSTPQYQFRVSQAFSDEFCEAHRVACRPVDEMRSMTLMVRHFLKNLNRFMWAYYRIKRYRAVIAKVFRSYRDARTQHINDLSTMWTNAELVKTAKERRKIVANLKDRIGSKRLSLKSFSQQQVKSSSSYLESDSGALMLRPSNLQHRKKAIHLARCEQVHSYLRSRREWKEQTSRLRNEAIWRCFVHFKGFLSLPLVAHRLNIEPEPQLRLEMNLPRCSQVYHETLEADIATKIETQKRQTVLSLERVLSEIDVEFTNRRVSVQKEREEIRLRKISDTVLEIKQLHSLEHHVQRQLSKHWVKEKGMVQLIKTDAESVEQRWNSRGSLFVAEEWSNMPNVGISFIKQQQPSSIYKNEIVIQPLLVSPPSLTIRFVRPVTPVVEPYRKGLGDRGVDAIRYASARPRVVAEVKPVVVPPSIDVLQGWVLGRYSMSTAMPPPPRILRANQEEEETMERRPRSSFVAPPPSQLTVHLLKGEFFHPSTPQKK